MLTDKPDKVAIERALRELYSIDEVLEIQKSGLKIPLRQALTVVHFKFDNMWHTQLDGLAMGALLVVILKKLWLIFLETIAENK